RQARIPRTCSRAIGHIRTWQQDLLIRPTLKILASTTAVVAYFLIYIICRHPAGQGLWWASGSHFRSRSLHLSLPLPSRLGFQGLDRNNMIAPDPETTFPVCRLCLVLL